MKHNLFIAIILSSALATPASGGTIIGNVRAEARPEVQEDIKEGKYESRKYKFLERVDYDALKEFIVYIDEPDLSNVRPMEKLRQIVIQKNAIFRPHVLPVMVGTTVEWPNNDDIYHNVFSMSEARPFDLGFYKKKEIKRVTFDKPGRVDVFCSIHTKMSCIVLVLENPFFASADDKGNYRIPDVPPGVYRLRAWHERLPSQVKTITIPQTGEIKVDFVLSVTGLPRF